MQLTSELQDLILTQFKDHVQTCETQIWFGT